MFSLFFDKSWIFPLIPFSKTLSRFSLLVYIIHTGRLHKDITFSTRYLGHIHPPSDFFHLPLISFLPVSLLLWCYINMCGEFWVYIALCIFVQFKFHKMSENIYLTESGLFLAFSCHDSFFFMTNTLLCRYNMSFFINLTVDDTSTLGAFFSSCK